MTVAALSDPEGCLYPHPNSAVPDLVGLSVITAEHLRSDRSDTDERVILTLNNGWVLSIGSSEWLHVDLDKSSQIEGATK